MLAQHDLRPLCAALFNEGLFDSRESVDQDPDTHPPKLKSYSSRGATLSLLWSIAKDNPDTLEFLWHECVAPLQARFNKVTGFDHNPASDTKSNTGLVGLRNLGCTCYMNSMMQQFFMVEHMRYGILSVEPNEEEKANPAESVMAQLQRNFGFLEASDRQDYNPIGFCQTYRDPDGNPVNVNVQQDAQEFLNFFM